MTDSEKAQIIITVDKSELERARNRMIAEGYRYRSLDNKRRQRAHAGRTHQPGPGTTGGKREEAATGGGAGRYR